jgi:hypothetical protein
VLYFGDSGQLGNRPEGARWISDDYNSLRKTQDEDGGISWWWLRSPGGGGHLAAAVDGTGVITMFGTGISNEGGARPALWLNLGV